MDTTENCGRCGYPKAEHVVVAVADEAPSVYICPTALFVPDTFGFMAEDDTK
jgi:hypothetical protein